MVSLAVHSSISVGLPVCTFITVVDMVHDTINTGICSLSGTIDFFQW